MKIKDISLLCIIALFLILAACSDSRENTDNEKEDIETEQSTEENNNEIEQEKEEESNEVNFEVGNSNGPEDQGDLNVWLEGEFHVDGSAIIVKGKTNLLPESELKLSTDAEEGILIGAFGNGKVEKSGDFEIEAKLPDEFEGLLHIDLSFESGNQMHDEITEHYSEGIEGSFARIYYDSYYDEVMTKASFQTSIMIDGGEQSFPIIGPVWNIPSDLGDPNVWINPTIEKFEDYVKINIESNLVEETFIRAIGMIPNYITTGFNGASYTNPDGSATIYIKDPEKDSRIKGLEKYEIKLEVAPTDGNNGMHVKEAYGEIGEKLVGDLVVDYSEGKAIEQIITITVE